jgi:hypothetical protein
MGLSRTILSIVALITALSAAAVAGVAGSTGADSSRADRWSTYVQIGALAGGENTDLDRYNTSEYRIFFECGLRWTRPPAPGRRLESVLLGPCVAGGIASGGREDVRVGFGPTAVWRLGDRWRLHTMAGVARSNTVDGLGLGAQLRGSLVWRNAVALDVLYYLVPVESGYALDPGGYASSLYGGVTFHGRTGGWVTVASAAGFIAFVVWFISSADFSHLD